MNGRYLWREVLKVSWKRRAYYLQNPNTISLCFCLIGLATNTMPIPQDDIDHALSHVLPYIEKYHKSRSNSMTTKSRPFMLGLTGLQGSGKSTWTDSIVKTLNEKHGYTTVNVSLDDLYLNHDDLVRVRARNPSNALLQTRGQPGTHDTTLARKFLDGLSDSANDILIPSFDKSKFNGQGDRRPKEEWGRIPAGTTVDVLVFEGWCVGFQPLETEEIQGLWKASRELKNSHGQEYPVVTLNEHPLEYILEVNRNLAGYCNSFMGPQCLDFLIHLDTDELVNVYRWRIQQEHALRAVNGEAMTNEEVVDFVRGYMPAYELYLGQLRKGFFGTSRLESRETGMKAQLRVVLDKERNVTVMSIQRA